jgi:hypothetical protein
MFMNGAEGSSHLRAEADQKDADRGVEEVVKVGKQGLYDNADRGASMHAFQLI